MAPWNAVPLTNLVVQIVKKRRGVILDDELIRALKKELGTEPSDAELNAALVSYMLVKSLRPNEGLK